MLTNSSIFITGGTGSFGHIFVLLTLAKYNPRRLVIFSRDEMKARGLRWDKIGYRPYPSQDPSATEKEISIGEFKQGFAMHLFPKYVLQYRIATVAVVDQVMQPST